MVYILVKVNPGLSYEIIAGSTETFWKWSVGTGIRDKLTMLSATQ